MDCFQALSADVSIGAADGLKWQTYLLVTLWRSPAVTHSKPFGYFFVRCYSSIVIRVQWFLDMQVEFILQASLQHNLDMRWNFLHWNELKGRPFQTP